MTKAQRNEAVARLLAFFDRHVGEVPEKARTDFGAWLKEGLSEKELQGLILQASRDERREFSEDVLEKVKVLSRPLRRAARPAHHLRVVGRAVGVA